MTTPQMLVITTDSYQLPQVRAYGIVLPIGCHEISYSARSWIVNAVSGLVPMLTALDGPSNYCRCS